ncbi:MAG: hypothetical protein ACTSW1_03160 [Candidatus Hodarchaeales archaeon]
MEIEYENKETITWCLDREGPRICLLAIRENNKLKKMKIDSEGFKLEIDGEEADGFLKILQQIVGIKKEEPVSEIIETEIIPETTHVEKTAEEFEEIKKSYEPVIQTASPAADKVEKEEYETPQPEPTIEYKEEELVEKTVVDEEIKTPEIPATSEILQILKKSEKTVDRLLNQEEVVEDTIDPLEDTASFFRHASKKSPLEELLDEKGNIKDELAEEPSLRVTEDDSLHKIFRPDDLQTRSFISQFERENPLDDLTKKEETPVEKKVDREIKEVKTEEPTTTKQDEYMTEAERRAAIERERAERRRRLWELTRGF